MGDTGLERNDVTDCDCKRLEILGNSGDAKSGAVSVDLPQASDPPKVKLILSLIENLTSEDRRQLMALLFHSASNDPSSDAELP